MVEEAVEWPSSSHGSQGLPFRPPVGCWQARTQKIKIIEVLPSRERTSRRKYVEKNLCMKCYHYTDLLDPILDPTDLLKKHRSVWCEAVCRTEKSQLAGAL